MAAYASSRVRSSDSSGTRLRDADCDDSVTREQVRDRLVELDDEHRIVLALRYVDVLPVEEIATMIGRTTTATYSLLARARDELRRKLAGQVDGGAS